MTTHSHTCTPLLETTATAVVDGQAAPVFDVHESGQLRIGADGDQLELLELQDDRIPAAGAPMTSPAVLEELARLEACTDATTTKKRRPAQMSEHYSRAASIGAELELTPATRKSYENYGRHVHRLARMENARELERLEQRLTAGAFPHAIAQELDAILEAARAILAEPTAGPTSRAMAVVACDRAAALKRRALELEQHRNS